MYLTKKYLVMAILVVATLYFVFRNVPLSIAIRLLDSEGVIEHTKPQEEGISISPPEKGPWSHHVNQFGYALASSYFDQMTGSIANFVSMQCWVSTLKSNVRVVEPSTPHLV